MRRTVRLVATWSLVVVHFSFATLAFFDRLSFTQPSNYALIELAADSFWWGWLFGLTGVALMLLLLCGPGKHHVAVSRACSTSAAFIGTWFFFTLLWGLTTTYPVSLALFGPAVFTVVGAQVLAVSWNHKE